jgi:hypothetical protein
MQELEEKNKVVSRYGNRMRARSKPMMTQSYAVRESLDPIETQKPKITVKTIQWYGFPDIIRAKYQGKTYEFTRDDIVREFFNETGKNVSYNQTISKSEQGKLFVAKLNRSGDLSEFIQFANYPVIGGNRMTTVSHRTSMFFKQAEDPRWDRQYRMTDSMYNEKIGESMAEDEFTDRFSNKTEEAYPLGAKEAYQAGIADALDVVKKTKGGKIDKRNALSTAIDQTGPDWAKVEGMLLVNSRLKKLDASYSRDIHKDLKRSVDDAVGGDSKDVSEFVVER